MAKTFLAALLMRVILPASLLFSLALRPFGLSFIYLLLYLISPHMQIPNHETINGGPGFCMFLYTLLSNMLLMLHAVWHIVLAGFAPYGSLLDSNPMLRLIGENLGLVSYNRLSAFVAVQYLSPELVMSVVSIIVHLSLKKLCAIKSFDAEKGPDEKLRRFPLLTSAGKYVCLLLIMASGIMYPSVTSGIYFLVFMGAATAWSLGQPLERGFAVVGRCVMAIMAVHMLVLITYQCTFINEWYSPEKPFARFFGLAQLVDVTVEKGEPEIFYYEHTDDFTWPILASPLIILFTYYILALETRELFKSKLLRSQTSKHWSSIRSRSGIRRLHQDSVGSVYVSADTESYMEPEEPTLMDDIIAAVIDFFEILVRSSYIATTIIMMAWSIMFHSWLAFVFLMWANVVWLCQDQRSFMLRTSPLLVLYAMILLLMQYVYSMSLLETELPSKLSAVNLQQIGLGRDNKGAVCVPLLIKSLFTCMFWVTLRQLVDEARRRRAPAEPPADLTAPLPLTPSNVPIDHEEEKRSRLMRHIGDFLKVVCARYWIYVVVIMLCVIGITGERMTIFRIVYMFLFLGFILMFQISWYWWRRLMYVFWITVIIYSMINLILLYIYQFDNFDNIIHKYLKIDSQLQHDLGLEPFEKADLFVKLLTPTCFLIITIVQVHYFHKDFMALSHPRTRPSSLEGNSTVDNVSSRHSQAGASTMKDDMPPLPTDGENPVQRKDSSKSIAEEHSQSLKPSRERSYVTTLTEHRSKKPYIAWIKQRLRGIKSHVLLALDKIFMYLHLHLVKIIFLALILLCALNVCAMHVPIVLLVIPGLLMNGRHQRCVVMFISVLISVYVMMKMIYQIQYIQPAKFEVNCTKVDANSTGISSITLNNAVWLGLRKADTTLPSLLKGYIGLIALFTFHSLVRYRQQSRSGRSPSKFDELVIFPEVTRKEADIDLLHCAKYLINYGFYKFGVELTLICLMGVIGSRMDMYSVFYAFWLLLLVGVKRVTQAKIWPAFTGCITILIPIQYMIAVGLTPELCVSYPWSGNDAINVPFRTWFFLPDSESPPHASKIVFDFVLLLFATRQLRVFRIEHQMGATYPGGCNSEDIGSEWETPSFVNPVPDFLGVVSTWLDLIKRLVFLVMLWVTLAIMFLTGTNRVNLFSMGYLIGSFIFLWQGTDFYLRPKESILQWWSWLLGYNVTVVVVKTLLQIPGCLYATEMRLHACWLVQLLGIGCVDKFAGGNIHNFLKMNPSAFKDSRCSVPQEDIGLAWDGVCFAFLILQKRLFHSYYFYRVIDESKATTVLASRGAELIEELRVKQMMLQEDQEVKILEKIKVKMERIKANQKKVQGAVAKDPPHHDTGIGSRSPPLFERRVYTKRHEAVRSGDYYMFDEFDDTEVPLKVHDSSSDEDEPKEMGLGKRPRQPKQVEAGADRDEPDSSDVYSHPPADEAFFDNLLNNWYTVSAFISSAIVTLTKYLMRFSRDYRYVSRALSMEKKILKEQEGFGIGLREGSQMIWEPLPEVRETIKDLTILEEQEDSMFKQDRNPVVHLAYAVFYTVVAHTDIVCYIMVFINQIQSATILSIPLPLMVFLWGTLTIPRPTKTFWVTLIAYTEVIVLLKSMFQFEILPWNQMAIPDNMPFTAPRIIGIERKSNYALYDLLLLLIIFLHRFMLKSLGLWKESSPESDLRRDMEFPLSDEDTQLIVEGELEEVGKKYLKLHDEIGPEEEQREMEKQNAQPPSEAEPEPEAGPSNAIDGDHYKVNDDHEPIIAVSTSLEDKYGNIHRVLLLGVQRYLRPTKQFFKRMLAPGARVTADVYAYMFLCDFFNFLVVIFGFAAFGTHQGDGGVQAYLEENKVPIPFLVMLILQFVLIVVDRALYLRKYILGKILFQYALIIGVHIWMFFVLPSITERTFNARLPPPIWYMVKCLYLLLSAHQIRCGYPRRIIGNFLCKSYRFLNMVFFRCFMAVPFVFELRTLMDWIWTDTSMTLMDWLKMEDIFASVFLLKCSRYIEDEYPQPRGLKKSTSVKYFLGGSVLAFVIAIIWFPLVFFAFGDSVGKPNPPTDVTVKIRIGPFLPVYQMSAQSHNIEVFNPQEYGQLSNQYSRDRTAQTFLSNYMYNDVAVIVINPNSTMKWEISPPELDRLEREAASNGSLLIRFTFVITRPSNNAQNPPTIDDHREMPLEAYVNGTRNPERETLVQLLAGNATSDTWLNVDQLFPKFLKIFNKGIAKPSYQLIPESIAADPISRLYRNVQLRLERDSAGVMYWRVREACTEHDALLLSIPKNTCDMLVMYTFNDKLFPETLNFISGGGIIGLYTTFVFLASRVLRGFFSGIYTKIMFDDLPNVDRVLQLCLDIYLVREALELALEEDLFAKLVFLYRSPETMIKWTRPKDEEPLALPAPPP